MLEIQGYADHRLHPWAVDGYLRALRGLLAGKPEGESFRRPSAMNVTGRADDGVARAIRNGPLPEPAAALLAELDRRLGVVFDDADPEVPAEDVDENQEQVFDVAADGVLACVEGRRVTALRRGNARIYRVRHDGSSVLEVAEERLLGPAEAEVEAEGTEPERWRAKFATSRFGAPTHDDPGPWVFDLAPGEGLVFMTGDVLRERDEAEISAALAEPTLREAIARLETEGQPLTGIRRGILLIVPQADAQPDGP